MIWFVYDVHVTSIETIKTAFGYTEAQK